MPDQYIEIDNVFPQFKNSQNCWISTFSDKIIDLGEGDIVEFGVASAQTTIEMAKKNPNRKVFAIDHFKGLEQTKQPTPKHSGWHKGAFAFGDPDFPHIPKTMEELLDRISPYPNINLIVEDVHELKHPSEYGIGKIAAVNVDVDIYEPTVSSLKFLDLCEWDKLYIRFDDWHGHDPQFDHHERKACKEWIERTGYNFDIPENGPQAGGVYVWK